MKLRNTYSFNKLKLQKLSTKHLKDLGLYSQNKIFFKYLEYGHFKNQEETKRYFKKKIKDNNFVNNFWWSIILKQQSKAIGTFNIHGFDRIRKSCEISYGISPKYQGKGYFKLILKNILNILKKKNIVRVQAITSVYNKTSIMGLKSCGFKKEGILKNYYYNKLKKKSYNATILSKT